MLKLLSQSFHIVFEVVPCCLVLMVSVLCSNAALRFLKHPHFVKSDDASFKLLEVLLFREECLVDVIFELSLDFVLICDDPFHLTSCFRQTFLPHP